MGYDENIISPVEFKIEEENSSSIKQIIYGFNFTFAICENNKIYRWGLYHPENLYFGDDEHTNKPVEFKIEERKFI